MTGMTHDGPDITGGVDTHGPTHHAAVIDTSATGRDLPIPASPSTSTTAGRTPDTVPSSARNSVSRPVKEKPRAPSGAVPPPWSSTPCSHRIRGLHDGGDGLPRSRPSTLVL